VPWSARRGAKKKRRSEDADFFDYLLRVEELIERQAEANGESDDKDAKPSPSQELISTGVDRLKSMGKFLARRDHVLLIRMIFFSLIVGAVAIVLLASGHASDITNLWSSLTS
jgi:hypothetical protein